MTLKRFSLMVQGTTTDAGKSMLVAALGRFFYKKGAHVAPFKPQNMALNSAVTDDGGEIGRAQAVQAQACGLRPHTDFNPVLIKPSSDIGAQIIIHGQARVDMDAKDYHAFKPKAMEAVLSSYQNLQQRFEVVVIEGAGSPAEINLRDGDIANMGFAEEVDCPVILIADIDKGGVFAHIIGTLELLSKSEQNRILGFVINKFRGDIALLQNGLDWLEEKTGKPVFAVLPYMHELFLEAEDAIIQENQNHEKNKVTVVVPVLPRISNHTDFDALRLHPNVNLVFSPINEKPIPSDLIILPGSKNVREDLGVLVEYGWDEIIAKHLRYGGKVMGICGGLQMLGAKIEDPLAVESAGGESNGLGYLPINTTFEKQKMLQNVEGALQIGDSVVPFNGYEIHHGTTRENEPLLSPIKYSNGANAGYMSEDNQIFATYVHGIFDSAKACNEILNWVGLHENVAVDIDKKREDSFALLDQMLSKYFNFDRLNEALVDFYQDNKDR